jgi:hypothetical protein
MRRMNNSMVIDYFIKGLSASNHSGTLISTGDKLINYDTCIAQRKVEMVYINITRYSNTTTRIQNELVRKISGMSRYFGKLEYLNNIEIGTEELA